MDEIVDLHEVLREEVSIDGVGQCRYSITYMYLAVQEVSRN
jgi:hypothetical protein